MSSSRPDIHEEEVDLLKLQREFLQKKKSCVPENKDVVNIHQSDDAPSIVQRKRRFEQQPLKDSRDVFQSMDANNTDLASVLTNINELTVTNKPISVPSSNSKGFPCAKDFKLTGEISGKSKKSLFAQQYDKRFNFVSKEVEKTVENFSSVLDNLSSKEKCGIEKDVDEILDKMSETDKLEEAQNLMKNIDPKVLEYLIKKKNVTPPAEKMELELSSASDKYLKPDKQNVEIDGSQVELPVYFKVGEHHNMDHLEPEKLQWMTDLPPTKSIKNGPSEARFDFDGKVIPRGTEIHIDQALHHHGDDAGEGGYTIEELFLLSRSAVQRQREIALLTLIHITQRARHRLYNDYLQEELLPQLLDSGIVQLFRHGLDGLEYELALQGLVALMVSPIEVILSDYMWSGLMYSLQPENEIQKDMEHDEVLKCDVVRVLLDSNIAQRMWYLLTKCTLTPPLLQNILSLLLHLAQHSLHAATVLTRHPLLLNVVVKCSLPAELTHFMGCAQSTCTTNHPNYKTVSLLKVLCMSGVNNAKHILTAFGLDNLIKTYISLPQRDIEGTDMVQCQVEMLRIWSVLLRYGLCQSVYTDLYSILVKELHFGGQRSVRITGALLDALSTGLPVLPWSEVGCLYQAVCSNIRSWSLSPPSEAELPPSDDLLLLAAILRFISVYTDLHYKRHCDITLIDEVCQIMDSIVRPIVMGPLFEASSQHIQYTTVSCDRDLSVPSLPTLQLHQYHQYKPGTPLDFTTLSPEGTNICSLHACSLFLSSSLLLVSTCCQVNKELLHQAQSITQRECVRALLYMDKPLPTLLKHSVLTMQRQLVLLSNKINCLGSGTGKDDPGFIKCAMTVFSSVHPGYEHWQHPLLLLIMSDPVLRSHYIHLFEATVTRTQISKSELTESGSPQSLLVGKFVIKSKVRPPWLLLSPAQMLNLTENKILSYLRFVLFCEENKLMNSVPIVVRLIRVMQIFLVPSQPFLTPELSDVLQSLLHIFSSSDINFSLSSLSSQPSFYDFYLTFCTTYQAESFGNPVFAGYLLLPTQADYTVIYRRLIWLEQPEVLSSLYSSALPLGTLVSAAETCPDMLSLYVTGLVSGVKGIPHKIAIHQVASFLFNDQKDRTLRAHLIKTLNRSNKIKDLVLRYKGLNGSEPEFYDEVPKERNLD